MKHAWYAVVALCLFLAGQGSLAQDRGFGLGVILSEKFDIGLHYFTSEPEYEVTVQGGGNTVSGKFKQPTSVFQLMVGYVIALD